MAMGPVQLLVLGFDHPNFEGEIIKELERLRNNDLIRVIDAMAVYKDKSGDVATVKDSQLSGEEMAQFGATVGALVGLGVAGEEGMAAGAELGALTVEERSGVFDEDEAWDVFAEIPEDSAAAMILLEHRWAIPLRDAIAQAGGYRLAAEFISPLDLIGLGLVTAAEAEALASADSDAV
jgi:uncharacterized membrane protein